MDTKNVLKLLTEVYGVSGDESEAANIALGLLKVYDKDARIIKGNVIGKIGGSAAPKILLDAHIDQIGLIVTHITDDGFIKVSNCGGIDRRLLHAQRVKIHGKKTIDGVIVSTPPHLSSGEEAVMKMDEVYIDAGYDKKSLEEIVSQGDRITFFSSFESLAGGRVSCTSLDDRSGVASILYALEQLKDETLPFEVDVMFSTQEEIGERGAKIGAFTLDPDVALAVDVSFAYATGEKEDKCGKMGEGVMIGISPSLDRDLSDRLIETAKKKNIPYQVEVMSGRTETNADMFSVNRDGAAAATLSIPLKYMHTPTEVVQISDVENVGQLIAEYVRGVM